MPQEWGAWEWEGEGGRGEEEEERWEKGRTWQKCDLPIFMFLLSMFMHYIICSIFNIHLNWVHACNYYITPYNWFLYCHSVQLYRHSVTHFMSAVCIYRTFGSVNTCRYNLFDFTWALENCNVSCSLLTPLESTFLLWSPNMKPCQSKVRCMSRYHWPQTRMCNKGQYTVWALSSQCPRNIPCRTCLIAPEISQDLSQHPRYIPNLVPRALSAIHVITGKFGGAGGFDLVIWIGDWRVNLYRPCVL